MTANLYLAATVFTAVGEVVLICAATAITALIGTEMAWTLYGLGLTFLVSNHLIAFVTTVMLRVLAAATRRAGPVPALVGGLLAAVLPALEIALALPTSACVAGIQLALWLTVWGVGLASAWRAINLYRLERSELLHETL